MITSVAMDWLSMATLNTNELGVTVKQESISKTMELREINGWGFLKRVNQRVFYWQTQKKRSKFWELANRLFNKGGIKFIKQ